MKKNIEKHIYNQIYQFTELNNIPSSQSGFRKHLGTSTALTNILNDIRINEDQNQSTCMALLDFNKAFDTVNHKLLLAKLRFFGFAGDALNFMKNFLYNRQSCVRIDQQSEDILTPFSPMGDQGAKEPI